MSFRLNRYTFNLNYRIQQYQKGLTIMAKTKEELNTLKTEYEALATKLQELTEEELKLVIGGTGETSWKYSFRDRDWVILDAAKDKFLISENVDTNDGGYKVRGVRRSSGNLGVALESTMSASTLLTCY